MTFARNALKASKTKLNPSPNLKRKKLISNKLPKIKPLAKAGYGLAEISQSMNLQMALLQKDGVDEYTTLTPHVKCRDFLCDVYSSDLEKKTFAIYGMSGLWPKHPDWTGVYLHLNFPNDKAKQCFIKQLGYLWEIEEHNGRNKTHFLGVDDGLQGMVIGDKEWLTNCLNFSLYTFMLRVLCYELPEEDWLMAFGRKQTSDSRYVNSINVASWDRVLKDLNSIKTKDFCGLSFGTDGTGAVHHNSGFISVFGSHTEINTETVKKNAHWKEMKARGFKLHTA